MGGGEFVQRSTKASNGSAAAAPAALRRDGPGGQVDVPRAIRRASTSRIPTGATSRAHPSAAVIHRKIAVSADPVAAGPVVEIGDSNLAGDIKANAEGTLALVRAGTTFEDHPWVAARAKANGGKVPNSAKSMKWKWPHKNRDGHLPGVRLAGGYDEYYVNKLHQAAATDKSPTDWERLVISTSTGEVFHTGNHYGDKGSPAFTHMGKL